VARKRKQESKGKQVVLPVMRLDAAGIDIGATEIFVAVPADRAEENVRSFPTFTQDLYRLADWLQECGIKTVAIAYASHCTSLGRCETFSSNCSLFDNLTPLAFRGGLAPGSS
jgi:hypothetical protein